MKRTLRTVSRYARRAMSALIALVVMTTLPIPVWADVETASTTTVEAKWGTSADALTNEGTLLEAINAAEASGSTVAYIQLQAGVTTTADHNIFSGIFTLDLNGQTLTRADGNTLFIDGSSTTVTLTDTSTDKKGKVEFTGSSYRAVDVADGASVTINAGNYESSGLVMLVYSNSSVNISDGAFTATTNAVIDNNGTLIISGGSFGGTSISASVYTMPGSSTTITGGTFAEGSTGSILYEGGTLDLTGYTAFNGFSVYYGYDAPIPLPTGYCFYDSSNAATIVLERGHKYTVGTEPETKYTITYAAGDGTGEMTSAISYGAHLLPECTFTAPADKMFKAWQVDGTEYQPGAVVTVSANTTVTAVWCDYVPQIIIRMKDGYGDGWHGDAIAIKKDGEEMATATIENGNSATLTLDYDNSCEYTFYWKFGTGADRFPSECSFEIFVEGESVLAVEQGGCAGYTDGQLLHTIEILELTEESVTIADGELDAYEVKALTHVGALTYTRTLNNLLWNALYVPFEIPVSQLTENYDVAYINAMHSYDTDDNGAIDSMIMEVVKIKEGTLLANYPYLIRAKNEEAKAMEIVVENSTLYATKSATVDCSSVFTKFEITGTYQPLTSADIDGCYALSGGKWKTMPADATLNPFRLYMRISDREGSPVKVDTYALEQTSVTIRVQGEEPGTTSIEENYELGIMNDDAPIYNLMGQPVENPVKGHIYIQGGRKVVW